MVVFGTMRFDFLSSNNDVRGFLWLILYFLYYCTMRNGIRRTLLSNSASLSKLIDTKIQLVEKQRNHWPPSLSLPAFRLQLINNLKREVLGESAQIQPTIYCLLLTLPLLSFCPPSFHPSVFTFTGVWTWLDKTRLWLDQIIKRFSFNKTNRTQAVKA